MQTQSSRDVLWSVISFVIAAAPAASTAWGQCDPIWRPFASEVPNGPIESMVVWDPDGQGAQEPWLVVAGPFSTVGSTTTHGLAAWNGRLWFELPGWTWSPNMSGASLTVDAQNRLLVAGSFHLTLENGDVASGVIRFDGLNWQRMGDGLPSGIEVIFVSTSGTIFVGGSFDTLWTTPRLSGIARWDEAAQSWRPLGTGLASGGAVRSIEELPSGDLIVGGNWNSIGGVVTNGLARWDGNTWAALGTSPVGVGGFTLGVQLLHWLPDGSLVAGGDFTSIQGAPASRLASWDASSWRPIASGGFGTNGSVTCAVNVPNGPLLVGGTFGMINGIGSPGIAAMSGEDSWTMLGSGLVSSSGSPPQVSALAKLPSGEIVVGGRFAVAGQTSISNLAVWGTPCQCAADLDDDGILANGGRRDGAVEIGDLLYFVSAFESADPTVDIDDDGDPARGLPDGSVDISDLLYFLSRFELGC